MDEFGPYWTSLMTESLTQTSDLTSQTPQLQPPIVSPDVDENSHQYQGTSIIQPSRPGVQFATRYQTQAPRRSSSPLFRLSQLSSKTSDVSREESAFESADLLGGGLAHTYGLANGMSVEERKLRLMNRVTKPLRMNARLKTSSSLTTPLLTQQQPGIPRTSSESEEYTSPIRGKYLPPDCSSSKDESGTTVSVSGIMSQSQRPSFIVPASQFTFHSILTGTSSIINSPKVPTIT